MRLNGYYGTITEKEGDLYRNGATDYTILIPQNATEAERFAAEELTEILALAGVSIPTVTDEGKLADPEAHYIALGNTVYFRSLGLNMTQNEYKFDGFIIESIGNTHVIKGVNDTGTCFGVYGFAEYAMGFVHYARDEQTIARSAVQKEFHIKDIPTFFGRNAFSFHTSCHPDNGFRLRVNGDICWRQRKPCHGEATPWSTLNDQSYALQILDYKVHREAHPDWYYVNPENFDAPCPKCNPQICFSKGLYDEEFFNTFMDNLLNGYIIPEKSKMFFMLGMSDTYDYCNCPTCNREVEQYTHSGLSMRFVNKVADAVEAWRKQNAPEREIYLISFAYHTTIDAPVIKEGDRYLPIDESVIARDNVIIRYAPIRANYLYPLMDEEHNKEYRDSLLGWHAVAKHLCIWDYRQDFHSAVFPYPNIPAAQANNDTYIELGVMDVFNQAQRFCAGSPFAEMDDFARARLHWNGKEDYIELCDEFRKAYYKEAEPYVTEYYQAWLDYYPVLEKRGYNGYCHNGAALRPDYYTLEELDRFEAILQKALSAARTERIFDRVEQLLLFPRCIRLFCFHDSMSREQALSLLTEVRTLTQKYALEYYHHWNKTEDYLNDIEKVIKGEISSEERQFPLRY